MEEKYTLQAEKILMETKNIVSYDPDLKNNKGKVSDRTRYHLEDLFASMTKDTDQYFMINLGLLNFDGTIQVKTPERIFIQQIEQ